MLSRPRRGPKCSSGRGRTRPAPRAPRRGIVWPIGVLSAAATIGFGVLFGEWFGDAGQRMLGLGPVWLDRREAIVPLLVLAISIGVPQVGPGLVLGLVDG